jgi:hypothetical protein
MFSSCFWLALFGPFGDYGDEPLGLGIIYPMTDQDIGGIDLGTVKGLVQTRAGGDHRIMAAMPRPAFPCLFTVVSFLVRACP